MGLRIKFQQSNSLAALEAKVNSAISFTSTLAEVLVTAISGGPGEYTVGIVRLAINRAAEVFTGSGLDDATSGGTYTSTTEDARFYVEIDATGIPDTFKWKKDTTTTTGTYTTGVSITGSAQTLSDGVTITFAATTGHTLADVWTIDCEF